MPFRPERRLAPRRNASIQARIVFDGGRAAKDCVIRNVSESGAKLELASVAGVPDTFDLLIPGHAPQPCRVAWRALKEMGVAYRTS
jgi:hypothetical protein